MLRLFRSARTSISAFTPAISLHSPQQFFPVHEYSNCNTNTPLIIQQQIRFRSNRSRRGLYDGKDIRTGNNVSFSMRHTKRKFKPNVFLKRIYSEILDDMIRFHVTTSALRSIDKAGGLDNYLLNNENITEGEGLKIKNAILKRLKNQAKLAKKAALVEVSNQSEQQLQHDVTGN